MKTKHTPAVASLPSPLRSIGATRRRGRQDMIAVTLALTTAFASVINSFAQEVSTNAQPLSVAPAVTKDSSAPGGGEAESQEALAKASQNPLENMINVPFQNNFNFGIGPNNVTEWELNVQPVIPFSLNKDWNLITRTIIPVINKPSPAPGAPSAFGLGDINPQFYFTPAKPGKLIWGVGPTLTLPTGTESILTSGEYSAGPAAVALTMPGHWVIGALANQQWSFAGWGNNYVSALTIQQIVNYNLGNGWYLVSSPTITANWQADSRNQWTVPVGGGVGKIFKIGKQAFNAQIQAFDNVQSPVNGPDWQLRVQIQVLFPK